MKRNYQKPTMSVVEIQNCSICDSSNLKSVSSNASLTYGGRGSGPARANRRDIWDGDEE
jgi:hypothetical protein